VLWHGVSNAYCIAVVFFYGLCNLKMLTAQSLLVVFCDSTFHDLVLAKKESEQYPGTCVFPRSSPYNPTLLLARFFYHDTSFILIYKIQLIIFLKIINLIDNNIFLNS